MASNRCAHPTVASLLDSAPMPFRFALLACVTGVLSGCGAEECSTHRVTLSPAVDGRPPSDCGANVWALAWHVCRTSGGGCGECACGEAGSTASCPGVDACSGDSVLDLSAGEYRVCLVADQAEGLQTAEACETVDVPSTTQLSLNVDTDDAWPCVNSWTYNGSLCCHPNFGCVSPER